MADALPTDPFGGIAEGAATVHEIFLSFKTVGFSEDQAFQLALVMWEVMITASMGRT